MEIAICKILSAPESPVARLTSSFTRAHSRLSTDYSECDILGTYHYLEGRGIRSTYLSFHATRSYSSDLSPRGKGFCIVDKSSMRGKRNPTSYREKRKRGRRGEKAGPLIETRPDPSLLFLSCPASCFSARYVVLAASSPLNRSITDPSPPPTVGYDRLV